ncbi:MAG: nuclease [SAR202 cluster bacterium]|nr:nuclease [SAR202 cluster bacterium]
MRFPIWIIVVSAAFTMAACGTNVAPLGTPLPSVAPPLTGTPPSPVATAAPQQPGPPQGMLAARVVRVIDGDTIEVELDGKTVDVRYIGIDTPETRSPRVSVEYFGKEADARNRSMVEGKIVFLEKDVSETDQFGRLLRYVYVGDVMINAALVMEGFAQASTYPPDVKYSDWFRELQRDAMESGRGLWASTEEPETTPVPFVTPTPTRGPDCDAAYPTVCLPSPPPDVDCGDIVYRRFEALKPDPHRLDADGNGIACEG